MSGSLTPFHSRESAFGAPVGARGEGVQAQVFGGVMGSVFDFPAGVDLSTPVSVEALFRAAGLSRRASLVLVGLGFETLDALHTLSPDDGREQGLCARLQDAAHCGPATIGEIDHWLTVSSNYREPTCAELASLGRR